MVGGRRFRSHHAEALKSEALPERACELCRTAPTPESDGGRFLIFAKGRPFAGHAAAARPFITMSILQELSNV
jgi:hypothetical protein